MGRSHNRRFTVFRGAKIDEVSPQDASKQQQQGSVLLDVRESGEWAAGHAPGAVHVPLSKLSASSSRFADQAVLTVCRSGARSTKAAKALAQSGIKVRNVAGGMSSWAAAGLPVVRDDGGPGVVA